MARKPAGSEDTNKKEKQAKRGFLCLIIQKPLLKVREQTVDINCRPIRDELKMQLSAWLVAVCVEQVSLGLLPMKLSERIKPNCFESMSVALLGNRGQKITLTASPNV